jgi:hypothetical protein
MYSTVSTYKVEEHPTLQIYYTKLPTGTTVFGVYVYQTLCLSVLVVSFTFQQDFPSNELLDVTM